jgi:hypothetical protein
MKIRIGLVAATAVALTAGTRAKPAQNIPVTSIISSYDSGVAPTLQIQSDGLGNYTNSNTQASLILASNGDWRLDDYYLTGATRKIYFAFTQGIPGTGPNGGDPVAPPPGAYISNFGANCGNFGNSMSTLPAGQTMECPMDGRFDYNGQTYVLHMAPRSINFPESTDAFVTCIFPTSGTNPCSQWRLWPSGTYTAPDGSVRQASIVNLSIATTVHGTEVYTRQGDFYFSFSILVTKP